MSLGYQLTEHGLRGFARYLQASARATSCARICSDPRQTPKRADPERAPVDRE